MDELIIHRAHVGHGRDDATVQQTIANTSAGDRPCLGGDLIHMREGVDGDACLAALAVAADREMLSSQSQGFGPHGFLEEFGHQTLFLASAEKGSAAGFVCDDPTETLFDL